MQSVIVLECNEVPDRVWNEFGQRNPDSHLTRLLGRSKRYTTVADDVPRTFLYPSQTWASFNTGVPYEEHKIHWYNDPKPAERPLYWKSVAASGRRVGYVNTLHSSPLSQEDIGGRFCFAIPDCFAESTDTYPARYRSFQAFNLAVTKANGKKSSLKVVLPRSLQVLRTPFSFGLSSWSTREIISTLTSIAFGKNIERLRNLQFPLVAEIFWNEVHRTDPELAILFTNHIAANMHRYWYALFPEDYPEKLYSTTWQRRYETDILRAVSMLDRFLGRLVEFCNETDRLLLICSSMGQAANPVLDKKKAQMNVGSRVDEPLKLLDFLGAADPGVVVERAMVPQYSFKYRTPDLARKATQTLERNVSRLRGLRVKVFLTGSVATLTVNLVDQTGRIEYDGHVVPAKQLGVTVLNVDLHDSGKHCPTGSLIIFNDKENALFASDRFPPSFSYLKFAPEIKRYFGC